MVDWPHPDGVAAGQVVVDGDDVNAPSGQSVEVGGQGGHQGFALAGFHFGDFVLVEYHAADELDIVMPLPQRAPGGFADDGESLGQQVVQRGAVIG